MPAAILVDGTVVPLRTAHDPIEMGVARKNGTNSTMGKLEICYYIEGPTILPTDIRDHVIRRPSSRWHSADYVIPNEKILYFIGLDK